MTGTEGEVQYLPAGAGNVTVHWNNPYAGSNSYSCTAPARPPHRPPPRPPGRGARWVAAAVPVTWRSECRDSDVLPSII